MISNELGQLVITKAVADLREKDKNFDRFATLCFCRYRDNDWGDLEGDDKILNDQALKSGDESIMASYAFPPDASREPQRHNNLISI